MRPSAQQMKVPENADYTKFQHTSSYHARLPCALCHRGDNKSAKPALPGASKHLPCAGCHVKQFADSSSPICTICHTNVQAGSLKPFPALTSFSMRFDHARHVRMNNLSCLIMSSAVTPRRSSDNSGWLQCTRNLLSMSRLRRKVRRPRYFFLRCLSSVRPSDCQRVKRLGPFKSAPGRFEPRRIGRLNL